MNLFGIHYYTCPECAARFDFNPYFSQIEHYDNVCIFGKPCCASFYHPPRAELFIMAEIEIQRGTLPPPQMPEDY